jgi:hypothetical protein
MGMKLTKTQVTHRIAKFLWEYYRDSPTAIQQLEGVTPRALERLTIEEKKRIIRERPIIPTSTKSSRFDSGRTNNWTDELWQVVEDNEELPSLHEVQAQWKSANDEPPLLAPSKPINQALVISHRRTSHTSHPYKRASAPAKSVKPLSPSGIKWIELDGHIDLTRELDFPM